jgi:hypothetical protein
MSLRPKPTRDHPDGRAARRQAASPDRVGRSPPLIRETPPSLSSLMMGARSGDRTSFERSECSRMTDAREMLVTDLIVP